MAGSAAHLVDHVFPDVPVRQWVISFPWRLRYLLALDANLCRAVRRVFIRAVFGFYSRKARYDSIAHGRTGAVNQIQRYGSALNANTHFHALVLDGVYTAPDALSAPSFHPATRITDAEVAKLPFTIRSRVLLLCRRRGLMGEEVELDVSGPSGVDADGRIQTLVPPPRLHQLTYHALPQKVPLAPVPSCRSDIVPPAAARRGSSCGGGHVLALHRYSFAELMKRVFRIDVLKCAKCGSGRRWIASI
ncbi:MAG: hypothetical protein ACI9F9_003428, partial [Candidatus Paceibacteria bacterium]